MNKYPVVANNTLQFQSEHFGKQSFSRPIQVWFSSAFDNES